jgi:hypothetical protein
MLRPGLAVVRQIERGHDAAARFELSGELLLPAPPAVCGAVNEQDRA